MPPVQGLYPRATLRRVVKSHSKLKLSKNVDVLIFLDYALFLQDLVREASIYARTKNAGDKGISAADVARVTEDFVHLIHSLEKHLITTSDLLTLDAGDIARRAQLPVVDLGRLRTRITALLHQQLGLSTDHDEGAEGPQKEHGSLRSTGSTLVRQRWSTISTLDPGLDAALGGGIPTGYLTEVTGESGAGKTQLLLSLLLSAQLPAPHGVSRPTLYISTEHALPTSRLSQLLRANAVLAAAAAPPSLDAILTLSTPDLEAQDHILAYQVPVALARHNIGLVVVDSIAANYRAENSSAALPSPAGARPSSQSRALGHRSADLVRTGALLRDLARRHDCAVVVANQVADRFDPVAARPSSPPPCSRPPSSSPPSAPPGSSPSPAPPKAPSPMPRHASADDVLALDHQQRWFTGWGDARPGPGAADPQLKTPTLGLVWTNQIACRIALYKEAARARARGPPFAASDGAGTEEWAAGSWRRWMRLVFAPWAPAADEDDRGVEFEVWQGGLRSLDAAEGGIASPEAPLAGPRREGGWR